MELYWIINIVLETQYREKLALGITGTTAMAGTCGLWSVIYGINITGLGWVPIWSSSWNLVLNLAAPSFGLKEFCPVTDHCQWRSPADLRVNLSMEVELTVPFLLPLYPRPPSASMTTT
ncbi:hypothetical protein XELAEV_18029991mg [Xenopus laevis]|uniref:Uncharacterized protein n=1 Tax=Xenopus laevis TaxID=8355 RepID=A0A974HI43_XENLA|nr:hypothetical protein XELAEV_18029991mg [Xenopus laevis]